ncbi:MAG: hypothetical protein A2787_04200 [Omnitrophica WOR_2 bacterium RIFCSPHIGHO2_01_FULL_48_9]|nr:MAG: hypothetical protein A3D10_07400 [Omnitrophica WOR_2 bacterium RIFCSPHIGHO2_02_FULL_48_11]OGX34186.1 MAG: hypothetical protein A2787_04200 [Omnitrophica WOR_2 bacterium RIFCSPHIGHO2_01_FULL_48_9]
MSSDAHDVKKEVKGYVFVFIGLMFLTIVTVLVSYFHMRLILAIAVALFIATIKASLVACYFMHLISEKKMIYVILVFTVVFFIAMMFLTLYGTHDRLVGTEMLGGPTNTITEHH